MYSSSCISGKEADWERGDMRRDVWRATMVERVERMKDEREARRSSRRRSYSASYCSCISIYINKNNLQP